MDPEKFAEFMEAENAKLTVSKTKNKKITGMSITGNKKRPEVKKSMLDQWKEELKKVDLIRCGQMKLYPGCYVNLETVGDASTCTAVGVMNVTSTIGVRTLVMQFIIYLILGIIIFSSCQMNLLTSSV